MITISELYALLPTAILGLGAVFVLLLGAFAASLRRGTLVYVAAGISLLSAMSALIGGHDVLEVGRMVGTGPFERMFSVVSGLTAFVTLLLSVGYVERKPLGRDEYPALMLFAAFGMDLLGSATSLLGVFLGLECMSLSLYVLLASNRSDPLSGEAGMKYLVAGAVSTGFFAFGLALIYFGSGDLHIAAAVSGIAANNQSTFIGLAGWGFLLVGLGFKASLFPFHLWAPDVYEGGPAPVVAFLSTGSKAAVFVAFIRIFLAYSVDDESALINIMSVMAIGTMIFGNVAALVQDNIKRLLAYSSVAQMGYVLLAVIASPEVGSRAAVFYLIVYVAMDIGVFGVVASLTGRGRDFSSIDGLKGMGYTHPYRCGVFTVCLLSLAGMPPMAGFIGKFYVLLAAIESGHAGLAIIGILTAIVAVYYYLRLIVYMYMKPAEGASVGETIPMVDPAAMAALGGLAAVILVLGIIPGWLIDLVSGVAL
jgi:NADH-quinone oxidoreductase subunit N